jgi:dihydroorotate dehydrogenase
MIPASLYASVVRPLMFRLKPETAHEVAMLGLRLWARLPVHVSHDSRTAREVFGVRFPNPVGLAAGFDKNAVALPAWESLGFGFVEAGTITAKAQPGNPKPRVFRIPEQRALINRMGFNNEGACAVAARLAALRKSGRWPGVPVGINIGKSRVTPVEEAAGDYLISFERLFPFADYFALNVSSPNTPGLRSLQDRDALDALISAVQAKNAELGGKPVLVKIAPDLEFSQIEEILALAEARGLAGIIATNTTLDHSSVPQGRDEQGGLSGAPLRRRSTEFVRFITARTKLPLIAVGGIEDAASAMEKLDAGAALIQLYTGFVYRGPSLPGEICRELLNRGNRS